MTTKTPKISVVMSAYNRPEYVKLAIESILNQTYKDFEFIIIDDCSIDNTAEVIQSYVDKDDRIVFIRNPKNMDYNYNLRKGFEIAKGEYIARMDDDDISMPERFAKQIEFMDKNPDITVLGTFIKIIGDENAKTWITETNPNILSIAMNFYNPMCHPSVMIRKSFLRQHNLNYSPKELYAEEYHLWKEIIIRGGKLANLPEQLVQYRVHKKSVTQASRTTKIQDKTAERVRKSLLGRFFNSRKVRKIRHSIFKYPFENNNKKKLFDILELMKNYPQILSKRAIEQFEQRYCGKPCTMEIFFASDNNFVQHLSCAMASILVNALSYENHNFYILDGGISEKSKKNIEKLKKIKDFNIEYIKVDDSLFDCCPITPECQHISKQTYYRYIIPQLKPEIEKCFYFDCDIVAEDTLNEFWNMDLGDNYIAAVEELWETAHISYIERFNLSNTFNAGCMLINNKLWKETNITDSLFANTVEMQKKNLIKWQDQDVLNYTFKDKIKFILPRYNLQQTAYFDGQHSCYSNKEIQYSKIHPVIIHYSGNIKPWQKNCRHPLKNRYYEYLKITPYKNKYYNFKAKKFLQEICNVFYRKKKTFDKKKIYILGIPIIKTINRDFKIKTYLFGIQIKLKDDMQAIHNDILSKLSVLQKKNETENKTLLTQINKDKRDIKYEVLRDNYNLIMRENSSDTSVFYQIFVDENYETEISWTPKIILDIGANVGYSAIYFAEKYPNSKIYSLESDIDNYNVLEKNTKKYPNIMTLHGALFDKNIELNIVDTGIGEWGYQVSDISGNTNKKVKSYTFEALLDYWNINKDILDIVKIDIEGAEKEVFETDCNWLNKTKLIFIETHDRYKTGTSRAVLTKMLEYDYNLDIKGDNLIFTNNNGDC